MFFPLHTHFNALRATVLVGALAYFAGIPAAVAQTAVTTGHNDNARTGLNASETQLNTSNVNAARFGKLFECRVDDLVWSQPLYLPGVNVPNVGTRNLFYVTTQRSTIYAFDADKAQTEPVARRALIEAPYAYDTATYQTTNNSTPVIDAATGTIYVTVSKYVGAVGAGQQFWIHALDVATLRDKVPPVQIQGDVPSTGVGAKNGRWAFAAEWQKQRPALLLQGGVIYAAFGGAKDEAVAGATWNGWVFSFDAQTLARRSVTAVSPNANGGGIWQAANGLAGDGSNVYAVTSNGQGKPDSFSASSGGSDYGNSIVRFTPDLGVASYFTPYNERYLELADLDVGASGPMLFPGTNLLVTGDKTGRLYLVDRTNMGGFSTGYNNIVQDFEAWKGHLHGGPVYWNSSKIGAVLYGWPEHDYLKAYQMDGASGRFIQTPASKSKVSAPPGMPGGMLSVSANGNTSGSGIVWATTPLAADANKNVFLAGVVRAFDAENLSNELWNSEIIPARDSAGNFAKFAPPTVADGKLIVPTFSYKIAVYGLLPSTPVPFIVNNLVASGQLLKVALNWDVRVGATTYTVKRATASGGPYTVVASNLTSNSYTDSDVTARTPYFYIVTGSNAGGEGPKSAQVSATPFAPASGSVLSIDFNGGANAMGASEVAGLIAAPNWNNAPASNGQLTGLRVSGGASSSASAVWSSAVTGATSIAETPGNSRLMKGYISAENGTATTVTVQNLPANFTSAGYDVYLYSDGTNPKTTRAAQFSLAGTSLSVKDAQNRDFEGQFLLPDVANVGNTLVFSNLQSASFTLNVSPGSATDNTPRAPLNGLQIVAHQSAPTAVGAPTKLVATPGNNQVSLAWNAVAGATYYTLRRANAAGGPYTTLVADQIRGTGWGDSSAVNGKTYFYVVTVTTNGISSANSNEANAMPASAYVGKIISVDFGPASPAMATTEKAGSYGVARPNWNRAADLSGSLTALQDDKGASTGTSLTWKGEISANTLIPDAAGDNRMMRSFLSGKVNPASVTISNLPADFTRTGYDIYVYFDNANTGARTGLYTAATTPVSGTDAAGTNFSGTYQQGNNATGNFVKLMGFFSPSVTLTAKSTASADAEPGGAINGIQIVARSLDAVLTSTPKSVRVAPTTGTSAAGTARTVSAIYGDGNGATDIAAAYLRVGSGIADAAPLDVYYNGLQNLLYLYDGTSWTGGFAPGSANIISGPRGSVDCSKTTVTRDASVLTVNWNLTPNSALVGSKYIYCRVQDKANLWDNWRTLAAWTITAPSTTTTTARTASSVPSS